MIVTACPMAVAEAPVGVVWGTLTDVEHMGAWADGEVVAVSPPGRASPGQRIELATPELGTIFKAWLEVLEVDAAAHRLRWDAHLPLIGVINHQTTTLVAAEKGTLIRFG